MLKILQWLAGTWWVTTALWCKSISLFLVGPKDFKVQKSHQDSSTLSAVELYLTANKETGHRQYLWKKKTNWPEVQNTEHPLLNTNNKECLPRLHGLNQSLFFFISADTVILLRKISVLPSAPARSFHVRDSSIFAFMQNCTYTSSSSPRFWCFSSIYMNGSWKHWPSGFLITQSPS